MKKNDYISQPNDKAIDTLEKLAEYVSLEEEKGKWGILPRVCLLYYR